MDVLRYDTECSGVSMIFEAVCKLLLDKHYTVQSSKVEYDLFGRFANMGVICVLAQVDEVRQDLNKFWDRLKDMITNCTINFEKKKKDPIVLQNLLNLIFTTSNENMLMSLLSPNDSCFVPFRCSNASVTNTK